MFIKKSSSGSNMKTKLINSNTMNEHDFMETYPEEAFMTLMTEYKIMESHVVYFSAGESKIKEILIKKDPTFSV